MANDAYLLIIPYSQHCFLWNFMFYLRKAKMVHQYKKMLYHPLLYRNTIDENPIPLKQICVLSFPCLLLTQVLFQKIVQVVLIQNQRQTSIKLFNQTDFVCSLSFKVLGTVWKWKAWIWPIYRGGLFCALHMALIIGNNNGNGKRGGFRISKNKKKLFSRYICINVFNEKM